MASPVLETKRVREAKKYFVSVIVGNIMRPSTNRNLRKWASTKLQEEKPRNIPRSEELDKGIFARAKDFRLVVVRR